MSLSSVYHTGPVTALHCHGNYVLAGIGSRVHVYSIPHCELQQMVEVLPARVIHGIKPVFDDERCTNLCVYGQKCLRLIKWDCGSLNFNLEDDPVEFSDWIWDVTWLQGDSSNRKLCLALGHNVIVIYDVDKQCIISSRHCQEKCILYCARFLTSKPDCVILAAGTVFNQVVIWSAQSTLNTSGRVEPFHRLTGHQGVIFSVDFNPSSQLICSVSDDRSIRLYKVMFQQGPSDLTLQDWEKMETSLLHVLYGHSARVWDVRLLSTSFVSVGEDSTCCLWSCSGRVLKKFKGHKGKSIWSMCVDKGENFVITGGGDNSVRLWQLQQQEQESSNSRTRSLDLQIEDEDFPRNTMLLDTERVIVITNMGKLMLYNQVTGLCTCLMSDELFGSYTVMAVSPIRRYTSVAIGNIHGIMRILRETDSGRFENLQHSQTDIKVCDGKLLSIVWLGTDKLLTTAPDGIVNIWELKRHDDTFDIEVTFTFVLPPSKHRWVSAAAVAQDGSGIVVGDRTGSLFLFKLVKENKTGELVQTFLKIHGKAGVTFICCYGNQVYSAGRDGNYRTFVWTESGQLELLHINRVCKGFEWIEKLHFTDNGDIQIQGFYTNLFIIWSVTQNQKLLEIECGGGHRAWDYSCHGNKATFVYVKAREVKVTDVEMKSNQIIVKKCLHGRELCDAKFICAGTDSSGKSMTALVTCSEDTSLCLSLLYYKNSTPQVDVYHTLTGHISTVRCLFVCCSSQTQVPAAENENPTSYRKLIFSGGGRAQLKVWCVEARFSESGKVQSSEKNTQDTNVQGSGAEYVSQKNFIEVNEQHCQKKECVKSAQCQVHSEQTDHNCDTICYNTSKKNLVPCDNKCSLSYVCLAGLHLSNINRKCRKPWRQPVDNSDPETRILDLSVVTPEELGHTGSRSMYFISSACSDGFLRLLAFDEVSKEIRLLAATSYHDHCVLKTCHVIIPRGQEKGSHDNDHVTQNNQWPIRIVVLSAATDGKVAFWDVTDICKEVLSSNILTGSEASEHKSTLSDHLHWRDEPVSVLQLHQSGINSIFFGKYSDSEYILITGGDDNALRTCIVAMDTGGSKVRVTAEGNNVSAHAAQITGTWFVAPDFVVTVSIDQRVCVWKLERENTQIQLRMCGCAFTSVSDVANMDVWTEGDHHCLMISGNGLELFKLMLSRQAWNNEETSVLTKVMI